MLVLPSPKSHKKLSASPMYVPVNVTAIGLGPAVGVPENAALPTYVPFAIFNAT